MSYALLRLVVGLIVTCIAYLGVFALPTDVSGGIILFLGGYQLAALCCRVVIKLMPDVDA